MSGRFTKKGRSFGLGPLKCHFAQLRKMAGRPEVAEYLASVEIVPFIVGEIERPVVELADL